MTKNQAHLILDSVLQGFATSQNLINEALMLTGDLCNGCALSRTERTGDKPLRAISDESRNGASREVASFRDAEGTIRAMGWSRYLDCSTN